MDRQLTIKFKDPDSAAFVSEAQGLTAAQWAIVAEYAKLLADVTGMQEWVKRSIPRGLIRPLDGGPL